MKKLIFILPLLILFFSCSQNLPEISSATGTAVYDFEDDDSFPELRLGVFVDVTSDVHRAEIIKVICLQNNYEWECINPIKIKNGKNQFSGYTHFVMPENEAFPQGRYKVYYTDYNGNEESCVMQLSYNAEILEMKGAAAQDFLKSDSALEYWSVYNKEAEILFFGEKEDRMRALEEVWKRYPDAVSARTLWVSRNGREICIFPLVYKNEKKVVENESDRTEPESETGISESE